jgi:hypothetical protein
MKIFHIIESYLSCCNFTANNLNIWCCKDFFFISLNLNCLGAIYAKMETILCKFTHTLSLYLFVVRLAVNHTTCHHVKLFSIFWSMNKPEPHALCQKLSSNYVAFMFVNISKCMQTQTDIKKMKTLNMTWLPN